MSVQAVLILLSEVCAANVTYDRQGDGKHGVRSACVMIDLLHCASANEYVRRGNRLKWLVHYKRIRQVPEVTEFYVMLTKCSHGHHQLAGLKDNQYRESIVPQRY